MVKQVTIHVTPGSAHMLDVEHIYTLETCTIFLPEGRLGPNDVVQRIAHTLRQFNNVIIITAYPDAINFVGELVERGLVEAKVVLHRGALVTEHFFDDRGCLGTDWPIGILMPDHEAALATLLGQQ